MSNNTPLPVEFNDELKLDRFFSCERQDEFVYHVLAKHLTTPGFFLDIACATPIDASNTYVLEKYFGWDGIGFDIGDIETQHNWSQHRTSTFFQVDATSQMLTSLLEDHVDTKIVDYISLDVDYAGHNYVAQVLPRILDAGIKFKVMTLEHEEFKHKNAISEPTRKLLENAGYVALFKNVSFTDGKPWEDWWINPQLMPYPDIVNIQREGTIYHECVEIVKNFKGESDDSL